MAYALMRTSLEGVVLLQPEVFHDARGFFMESFNDRDFARATGLQRQFVQDNHSFSMKGVLRGLHYQISHPQGKLVRVVRGEVFDVVVDLRRRSPNFGKSLGVFLSAENMQQLWVPEGFAHGFLVTSESAEFLYKTTDYRYSDCERTLLWDDPVLGIAWPMLGQPPRLAAKDALGTRFNEADVFD